MSETNKVGSNTPKPGEQGFQKLTEGKKAPTPIKSIREMFAPMVQLSEEADPSKRPTDDQRNAILDTYKVFQAAKANGTLPKPIDAEEASMLESIEEVGEMFTMMNMMGAMGQLGGEDALEGMFGDPETLEKILGGLDNEELLNQMFGDGGNLDAFDEMFGNKEIEQYEEGMDLNHMPQHESERLNLYRQKMRVYLFPKEGNITKEGAMVPFLKEAKIVAETPWGRASLRQQVTYFHNTGDSKAEQALLEILRKYK